jgi:hypothetical protein
LLRPLSSSYGASRLRYSIEKALSKFLELMYRYDASSWVWFGIDFLQSRIESRPGTGWIPASCCWTRAGSISCRLVSVTFNGFKYSSDSILLAEGTGDRFVRVD